MVTIGVTPMWDEASRRAYINQDYLDSVLRAGGLPLVLPLCDSRDAWEQMLDRVDGVIFSGGADVQPSLYGEEKLPFCGETCEKRDAQESYMIGLALEIHKPFLAICRGFELLNVVLGGTLYQDIEQQMSDKIKHPRYEVPRTKVHGMRVVKGTLLSALTQMDSFDVNSRHHQGVKTVGRGLLVNAVAPDGLVEGLELPDHPEAMAVQWHPEALSDRYTEALALFNHLTECAREARA